MPRVWFKKILASSVMSSTRPHSWVTKSLQYSVLGKSPVTSSSRNPHILWHVWKPPTQPASGQGGDSHPAQKVPRFPTWVRRGGRAADETQTWEKNSCFPICRGFSNIHTPPVSSNQGVGAGPGPLSNSQALLSFSGLREKADSTILTPQHGSQEGMCLALAPSMDEVPGEEIASTHLESTSLLTSSLF